MSSIMAREREKIAFPSEEIAFPREMIAFPRDRKQITHVLSGASYVCVLGNKYWVYRFHGPYVLEEYLFHMNMTLYWMCRFDKPYMSWGVPFSYEICTGCTVSLALSWGVPFLYEICTRLCVCILGVLPQDMETVECFGSDLKCCYLTVEINT